jgi:death-on-curing protein
METFLLLNGLEIVATTDEQERLILELAAGQRRRDDVTTWLQHHTRAAGA